MPLPIHDACLDALGAFADALKTETTRWRIEWDHREHSLQHEPYYIHRDDDAKLIVIETHLHPGQRRLLEATGEIHVLAGTQVGKTIMVPLWCLKRMLEDGPGDGLVASPTYPLLEKKLAPEMRRLFVKELGIAYETKGANWCLQLTPFGRELVGGDFKINFGYATNSDSLESATYRWIVGDEVGQKQFKRTSYDALYRRTIVNRSSGAGHMLFISTPYDVTHWWHDITELVRQGTPGMTFIHMPTSDNLFVSEVEIERAKAVMENWRFQMMYLAIWSRPLAAIFPFDQAIHSVRRPADKEDRTYKGIANNLIDRVIGVDFGSINLAAVMLVRSPKGIWYVYNRYTGAATGRSTRDHAAEIVHALHPDPEIRHRLNWTAVGGAPSEDNWRNLYGENGLIIQRPPHHLIETHIAQIVQLMLEGRLKVMEDLEDVVRQIQGYQRKLNDQGEATMQIENERVYHYVAALRYACCYIVTYGL